MEFFFPFSKNGSLAPILRDPTFWARAYDQFLLKYLKFDDRHVDPRKVLVRKDLFAQQRKQRLREYLKPFLRRLAARQNRPDSYDTGHILTEILNDPGLRHEACKPNASQSKKGLPQPHLVLWSWAEEEAPERANEFRKLCCIPQTGEPFFLDHDRLLPWMTSKLSDTADLQFPQWVIRAVAAFCLLEPNKAASFADALIQFGGPFKEWIQPSALDCPNLVQTTLDSQKSSVDEQSDVVEVFSAGMTDGTSVSKLEVPPKECFSLNQLVHRTIDFGIGEVRALAEQLEQAAAELKQRVTEYDRLKERTKVQLQQIIELPILETALSMGGLWDDKGHSSFETEVTFLRHFETQTTRVLDIYEQFSALVQRLGGHDEWRVPVDCVSLDEIGSSLQHRIEVIANELRRIAKVETDVAAFVAKIFAADDDQRLLFVESAPPDLLTDIFHFVSKERDIIADDQDRLGIAAKVAGNSDLAAVVGAYLWQKAPDTAKPTLATKVLTSFSQSHLSSYELLAFLTFGQLQALALASPSLASVIAEMIFAGAVTGNSLADLEVIRPLLRLSVLHPIVIGFYSACLDSFERGLLTDPIRQFGAIIRPTAKKLTSDAFTEQRDRLLELLNDSSNMKGDYYDQLLANARLQFLDSLKPGLQSGKSAQVLQQWESFGEVDDLVKSCIRSQGLEHKLVDHPKIVKRFRRHLEEVTSEIGKWCQLTQHPGGSATSNDLVAAIKQIQKEAELSHDANCSQLFALMETLTSDQPNLQGFPVFVGQRCTDDGQLDDPIERGFVLPTMIHSWPLSVEAASVPLSALLLDRLLAAIELQPRVPCDAIKVYLSRRQFAAARKAALFLNDSTLSQFVGDELRRIREVYWQQHSQLITEARVAASQDIDVATCVDAIGKAVEELDFDEADQWLREIEDLLLLFRQKRDPERLSLWELLQEAGIDSDDQEDAEDLRKRYERLKSERETLRQHVLKLAELSGNDAIPDGFRRDLQLVSQKLDRPNLWIQDEYEAMALADSIDICVKWLMKRLNDRDFDPSGTDILVDCLSRGLVEWLQTGSSPSTVPVDRSVSFNQVNTLAKEIQAGCSDAKILHLLGTSPRIHDFANRIASDLSSTQQPANDAPLVPAKLSKLSNNQDVDEVRSFLQSQMKREPAPETTSHEELKDAVTRRHWERVRQIASSAWFGDHVAPNQLDEFETLYALALAQSLDGETDSEVLLKVFNAACLGIACEGRRDYYGIRPDAENQLLLQYVTRAARLLGFSVSESKPVEQFLELARHMEATLSPSEIAQWMSRLFSMASRIHDQSDRPGSAQLARRFWDSLTGATAVGELRRHLLYLLFRWKRMEALEHLCQSTSGRHASLIWGCVQSFERAEANPEVHSRALQLSSAVKEQLGRDGLPWRALFQRLEADMLHSGVPSHPVSITADFYEFTNAGDFLLEIRLEPSLVDVPNTLELQLGGENLANHHERLLDEPLTDEITRTVRVPNSVMSIGGDGASIAFRIHGTTIRGHRVDVRGVWNVPTVQLHALKTAAEPINTEIIRNAWPGVDGSPVRREHGFYGREKDISKIERLLNARHRQRSVMVFGQRRIGKTSLLHAIINSLRPSSGRLCGAFVDVKGLDTSDRTRSLSQLLFDYIVGFLDTDTFNVPILEELRTVPGFRSVRKLCADLFTRPALNIQLEELVRTISEMTNGRISRVAFFLDEFDRFVAPLYDQRAEEVKTLMWSLRQIVQRSERISLVLAGSGLQRLLVDDPDDALFGSIDRVQVEPFDWQADSDAIRDTLFPAYCDVRKRLIGNQPHETDLFKEANGICGGHPYYLALLGHSVALAAKGRFLTRPLLNQVVDQMVKGQLRSPIQQIEPNLFYHGDFEDLKRLQSRQLLAQVLLVFISQQVTTEFPWLSNRVVSESTDITQWMTENECYELLALLDKEGILELDRNGGRVRIRIPITAKALREDAVQIRDEAIRSLKSRIR